MVMATLFLDALGSSLPLPSLMTLIMMSSLLALDLGLTEPLEPPEPPEQLELALLARPEPLVVQVEQLERLAPKEPPERLEPLEQQEPLGLLAELEPLEPRAQEEASALQEAPTLALQLPALPEPSISPPMRHCSRMTTVPR